MLARLRNAQFLQPIQEFIRTQAASGVVLLLAAVAAIIWANSPWAEVHHHMLERTFTLGFDGMSLTLSVHHWINDGLMAVFFFVVGLEIKREFVHGEFNEPKQALLPIAAAVGGMVVPAGLYVLFNGGGPGLHGWGIPMATDIAFALGCAALLGRRVPASLIVFLTALAIVDDLGAVLVIALFYTSNISWEALGVGAAIMAALLGLNAADVRRPAAYIVLGLLLWLALLKSGVHATIAGVLLGMTIPANNRSSIGAFLDHTEQIVLDARRELAEAEDQDDRDAIKDQVLLTLEEAADDVEAPSAVLEHALHPWVTWVIMPIFALSNAGVVLAMGDLMAAMREPVTLGVLVGLLLGKPIGIMLACWLVVKVGLSSLPTGADWRQVFGVSILAGIGFTMSLFIGGLAFSDPALQTSAKVGILAASLLAGIAGSLWLVFSAKSTPAVEEAVETSPS